MKALENEKEKWQKLIGKKASLRKKIAESKILDYINDLSHEMDSSETKD